MMAGSDATPEQEQRDEKPSQDDDAIIWWEGGWAISQVALASSCWPLTDKGEVELSVTAQSVPPTLPPIADATATANATAAVTDGCLCVHCCAGVRVCVTVGVWIQLCAQRVVPRQKYTTVRDAE